MTAKAALCLALLEGRVLTVMNCFKEIGYTNIAREVPRQVEKPFGVIVSKTSKDDTNRYGEPITYKEYRLNRTEFNAEGIAKMKAYVQEEIKRIPAKTDKQQTIYRQTEMFLESI